MRNLYSGQILSKKMRAIIGRNLFTLYNYEDEKIICMAIIYMPDTGRM